MDVPQNYLDYYWNSPTTHVESFRSLKVFVMLALGAFGLALARTLSRARALPVLLWSDRPRQPHPLRGLHAVCCRCCESAVDRPTGGASATGARERGLANIAVEFCSRARALAVQ